MGKEEAYKGPFKIQDGERLAFHPDTNEYLPVVDVSEQWKGEAEGHQSTKEERRAFYQQKIQLIESSEGRDELRKELLNNLNEAVKEEEANPNEEPEPVPGGVGYGAYYKSGTFRFRESSVLDFKIVTAPNAGNEKNKWLYLTSTNRAPKGVEAYVAYRRQDTPMFKVFDWSKSGQARFAVSRPYDWFDDYLSVHALTLPTAGTLQYQTLSVRNSTRKIAEGRWMNEVMLHNPLNGTYDRVYWHEYDLPVGDEEKYLWWGPIVETFPPFPFAINEMGFFDAEITQDDAPAVKLNDTVTELKSDHLGAQVVLIQPNYSFVVYW